MLDIFTFVSLCLPLLASVVDVTTGEWLTLTQAAKLLPGRPHAATLWRWRTSGCRGVRLQTLLVGRRRLVNREMLAEFTAALTAAADGTVVPPQSTRQRKAAIEKAKREVAAERI